MRSWKRTCTTIGALALGILTACGGSDTNAPDCDAIAAALVSRIEVRPATATVNLGDSLQLQATAFSCAGQLGGIGVFRWRSGDATVATVSASGLVKAVNSGNVAIYAGAQGKEGSASVSTEPVPVARVTVEPTSATIGVGRTSRLTARAFDAQDREIIGRPVLWSSANSGVVSVNPQGDITGGATGGPIAVTATIEGKSASSQITVVLVPVNTVAVTPATPTIAAGTTLQLTATLTDELGNVLTGRAVSWTSSDPSLASVSGAGGLVTGLKPGAVTITATSEGKSGTAQVTVTLGQPAKLRFVQQPTTVQVGSAITPAVTVEVQDAAGNRVTTATSAVTVALAAPGGATLGGTLTVNAVNGLGTFSDLTVSAAGTFSLTAAAAGLTGATSASFVVTPRPATRLAFVQQPASAVAGASLGTITVELQDAAGARVTGETAAITLAIGSNPGGGTLSGTLTQTTANGLATFTGLSINRSGTGYTLVASATGLSGTTSNLFNITAGTASQLTFIVQPCPNPCLVDSTLKPAPKVAVQDALGNTVTGSTVTVAASLLAGGSNATLGGTASVQADGGVATFTNLTVNRSASGLRLRAASGTLAPDTSAAFSITNTGPQLAFSTQPPASVAAGAALPAVRVQLLDALGGSLTTAGVQVTLALGPSGTLNGTKTQATDANGVATFNDLSVAATVGTNYALTATASGFLAGVSSTFAVTAGAPSQLTFTRQPPTSVTVGAPISPAVTVQLRDASGNAVSQLGTTVVLTMSGGGTLTNASAATDASGLATFTGLTATATAGAGYTLAASSTGLASATSNAFAVVAGAATRLAFGTQPPASVTSGTVISPAVTVQLRDAAGNAVSQSGTSITLTLSPSGSATGNVATTNGSGLATFSALAVTAAAGSGYTLTASAAGLTSATSTAFTVLAGGATRLGFVTQPPTSVTVGVPISPAVTVQLRDAAGNAVSQSGTSITLAPSPSGSATGNVATTNGSGLATFSTLAVTAAAGSGYTLTANSTGLTSATSTAFTVVAGATTQLGFGTQPPASVTVGVPISPAVTVQLRDAGGNAVSQLGTTVVLTMSGGGTLTNASATTNASGLATFTGLTATATAGAGYTLTASSTGLASATSNAFAVVAGAATRLAFVTQPPASVTSGTVISPAVTVQLRDAAGNAVSQSGTSITLTPSPAGSATGNVATTNGSGLATFSTLAVTAATGSGYTLTASATGLTSATSTAFAVAAGAATQLSFATQPPASVTSGAIISPAVTVQLRDAAGNPVSQSGTSITLTPSPSGSATGNVATTNGSGLATFATLALTAAAGSGYTLTASSTGLTSATSTAFAVVAGAATQLGFVTQPPASVTVGVPISPAVTVQLRDAGGNAVSQLGTAVVLTMNHGGTLTNASATTNGSGLATFTGLTATATAGPGYTLTATSTGLASDASTAFAVVTGSATLLSFVTQPPASVTVGVPISPAVTVQLRDAGGNAVSQLGTTVALTMSGGGTLTNASATTNSSGLATFTGLIASATAGTGYTFTATSTGLASATSTTFAVVAGAATQLGFVTQPPASVTSGAVISPAVTVQLRDAAGNAVSQSGTSITLTPSPSGSATGNVASTNASGVATFPTLSVTAAAGPGYTLTASSTGLTSATSTAFAVVASGALQLGFVTQPPARVTSGTSSRGR